LPTTKPSRHDRAEILLKVALSTINKSTKQSKNQKITHGTLKNMKWEESASTSNRRCENLQR
jgi:hypothetical protein